MPLPALSFHRTALPVLAAACLWLTGPAGAQEFAPPRDFSEPSLQAHAMTPNRLIIGLEAGSELAASLADAAEGQLAGLAATDRLSELAGLPVTVVQVASGNDVVLVINTAALARDLARRVGETLSVDAVYRLLPIGPAEEDQVLLHFDLAEPALEGTVAELDGSYPSIGVETSAEPPVMRLSLDPAALLDGAAERVREAPGIAYVQPDRMLQPH